MPIIPMLPTGPLANAGGAVLDTQRRPTVSNGAKSQAVGALADAGKMPDLPMSLAENPGLHAIGRALQQGGDVIGALAIKRKEAESDVQVANADNAMASHEAEFETWKTQNPDPAGWDKEWATRASAFKNQLLGNEKLNDGARAVIDLRSTRWAGQSQANVAMSAAKQTFALAKSAFAASADAAIESQDFNKLDETLKTGLQKGYFFPHEAENWHQQFVKVGEQRVKQAEAGKERAQYEALAAPAITDPLKWLEENKEPWAGKEVQWQKIKNVADARKQEGTGAAVSDLADSIDSGDFTVPAEIDAFAAQNPFMTPVLVEHAKKLLGQRDVAAAKLDMQQNGTRNAVDMSHKALAYDRESDPDGVEYFSLKEELNSRVPSDRQGEISKILDQKFGGRERPEKLRPEIKQNISKSLNVTFDGEQGAIPWKKKEWVTIKKSDGSVVMKDGQPKVALDKNGNRQFTWRIDPAARQRAIDAQTKIEIGIDDWAKDNPDKASNPAEVQKQLQRLLPEGTRAGIMNLLQKKAPSAAPEFRGFSDASDLKDKLPAGLRPHAQDFIDAAKETGLNPRALAAISALETGGGTSKAFREKLNAMGISDNSGPTTQKSVRDSIFAQARTLARANGPYARARTLAEVGAIYAPPGAGNDVHGTNAGWSEGVHAWMARL